MAQLCASRHGFISLYTFMKKFHNYCPDKKIKIQCRMWEVELQNDADDLKTKLSQADSKPQPHTIKDSPLPDVSYDPNSVLVQASAAIDLRCNERQGRFLVANRDLTAGDTLIVERPYAAILLPDHYTGHCHHCFTRLLVIYPCRQCTMVKYCSPICEDESWLSYHKIECPYLDLLHSSSFGKKMSSVDFRESVRKTNETEGIPGLTESGKYERNYLTVYDLMTHTEDMNIEDLYQYSVTAVLLLRILQHSKWFNHCSFPDSYKCGGESSKHSDTFHCIASTDKTGSNYSNNSVEETDMNMTKSLSNVVDTSDCINHTMSEIHTASDCRNKGTENSLIRNIHHDDETSNLNEILKCALHSVPDKMLTKSAITDFHDAEIYIGGLLLRHIQQLVCNAHAITEVKGTQAGENTLVEETSQVRVATAIYPTASLMNHSCDPTIISSFHKDILMVRAVKDVKSGDEIFNCYGPHHKRMRQSERQNTLRDQYFFTCTCDPCTDATGEDLIYSSYSCPSCEGPLYKTTEKGLKCRNCRHTEDSLNKLEDEAQRASQLFSDGLELLQQKNYKGAIAVMTSCYKMRIKLFYKHNSLLAETQDCLARCYAMTGQFKKAAKYLQESIDTVRVTYGTQSIELANELRKLSEVLISAREWRQALEVTKEAITLFTLHYGKKHETVRDLCEAQTELMSVI